MSPGAHAILAPLARFYERSDRRLPDVRLLDGDNIPAPYHTLLVHDADMTSTLERFHGERVRLRILESRRNGSTYEREVVLVAGNAARPVEFGAIGIMLDRFSGDVQEVILKGATPLGAILQEFAIPFVSMPQAFFEIHADDLMAEALEVAAPALLYGRRNTLITPAGETLAEIVEILPPVGTSAKVTS